MIKQENLKKEKKTMSSRILIPQERISTIKKKRISGQKVTFCLCDQMENTHKNQIFDDQFTQTQIDD